MRSFSITGQELVPWTGHQFIPVLTSPHKQASALTPSHLHVLFSDERVTGEKLLHTETPWSRREHLAAPDTTELPKTCWRRVQNAGNVSCDHAESHANTHKTRLRSTNTLKKHLPSDLSSKSWNVEYVRSVFLLVRTTFRFLLESRCCSIVPEQYTWILYWWHTLV